jgi:hypothetical protein
MTGKFTGIDRRRSQRRESAERRNEVRWDSSKSDRRQSYGRRKEDRTWRLSDKPDTGKSKPDEKK